MNICFCLFLFSTSIRKNFFVMTYLFVSIKNKAFILTPKGTRVPIAPMWASISFKISLVKFPDLFYEREEFCLPWNILSWCSSVPNISIKFLFIFVLNILKSSISLSEESDWKGVEVVVFSLVMGFLHLNLELQSLTQGIS